MAGPRWAPRRVRAAGWLRLCAGRWCRRRSACGQDSKFGIVLGVGVDGGDHGDAVGRGVAVEARDGGDDALGAGDVEGARRGRGNRAAYRYRRRWFSSAANCGACLVDQFAQFAAVDHRPGFGRFQFAQSGSGSCAIDGRRAARACSRVGSGSTRRPPRMMGRSSASPRPHSPERAITSRWHVAEDLLGAGHGGLVVAVFGGEALDAADFELHQLIDGAHDGRVGASGELRADAEAVDGGAGGTQFADAGIRRDRR